MKLRLALAAATCLALPLVAHAQPVTGPYVSLEGGTSIANQISVDGYKHNTFGKIQLKNPMRLQPQWVMASATVSASR